MNTPPRRSLASDEDWQSDWDGARLHQLRRFRTLPLVDKIRAVEEMCRLARALAPHSRPTDDR